MIGYVYRKSYFYDKILNSKESDISSVIAEKEKFYNPMEIKKKNGVRKLMCLEKGSDLYDLQAALKNNFIDNISIPENVKGFIKGSSYKEFLLPHINNRYYLRVDIKNFFDNISMDMVENAFSEYFKIDNVEENDKALSYFADLVTFDNALPQGAVTSPTVSNVVFRRLDIRISRYCKKFNINYTRYADDLLFSSDNKFLKNNFFLKKIAYILKDHDFQINDKKVIKMEGFISLNGFVIKDDIYLSRSKKKSLSKILFILNNNKKVTVNELLDNLNNESYFRKTYYFDNREELINYLAGQRAFLINFISLNKNSKNYLKTQNIIKSIENNIDNLMGRA